MNGSNTIHRAARRAGFTLAECLISLGVLGVGLTMVAALFPAAILETERSVNASVGTLICENGLLAASRMITDINTDGTNTLPLNPIQMRPVLPIGPAASCYPTPAVSAPTASGESNSEWLEYPASSGNYVPRTTTGFAILARQTSVARRYEVIVIAYRKLRPENNVRFYTVAGTAAESSGKYTVPISGDWLPMPIVSSGERLSLRVGAPAFFAGATSGTNILKVGTTHVLDYEMQGNTIIFDELPTGVSQFFYALMEVTPDDIILDRDPVMSVMKAEVTVP